MRKTKYCVSARLTTTDELVHLSKRGQWVTVWSLAALFLDFENAVAAQGLAERDKSVHSPLAHDHNLVRSVKSPRYE